MVNSVPPPPPVLPCWHRTPPPPRPPTATPNRTPRAPTAWECPGGIQGADQVTGYSPFFGAKPEDRALKYVDQVPAWKKFGPVSKLNLYYSWKLGCLLGLKVTYGDGGRSAQLVGVQSYLTEKDIRLGPLEVITKVEVKEAAANRWGLMRRVIPGR